MPHDRLLPPVARAAAHDSRARGEVRADRSLTWIVVGDSILFTGEVSAIVRRQSSWPGDPARDHMVLAHVLPAPPPAPQNGVEAHLLSGRMPLEGVAAALAERRGAQIVGVAVPVPGVHAGELAASAPLRATPLVRASRGFLLSMVASLQTALDAPVDPTPDDVLSALVRGVIRENPGVLSADLRRRDVHEVVVALIDEHHREADFGVGDLAALLNFSRRHLYRRMSASGSGIARLIADRRVQTARDLIEQDPSLPLLDVAARSGFGRSAALRAQFLRSHGLTPSEFRESVVRRGSGSASGAAEGSAGLP